MSEADVLQVVAARTGCVDVLEAAVAQLDEALAAADAQVVHVRVHSYGAMLDDPAKVADAVRTAGSPRRNTVVVLDLSNEGVPFVPRFRRVLMALRGARRDGRVGVVFVQNNALFGGEELPLPLELHPYHHHASQLLRNAVEDNVAATGLQLLDRPAPLKAFLCLNATTRLHRMLTVAWLARALPGDHVATFAGPERQKIATEGVVRSALKHFPSVDLEALTAEVAALRLPEVSDPDLPWAKIVHGIEPETYRGTFASFVTETEMSAGEVRRFTEKMLKPLAMGHPVIVAGNPGTVAMVEALGFDLLTDAIDASYDDIAEPEARLAAAQGSALALAALDQDGRTAFLQRHRDRLAANVELFDGRLLRRLEERWTDDMVVAIARLLPQLVG